MGLAIDERVREEWSSVCKHIVCTAFKTRPYSFVSAYCVLVYLMLQLMRGKCLRCKVSVHVHTCTAVFLHLCAEPAFETESSSLSFEVDTSAAVYNRVRDRIINWLVQWISPNRASLAIGVPQNLTPAGGPLASSSSSSLSETNREQQSAWFVSRKEQEEQMREQVAMLTSTLYGSQENVILVHEMLRQVSLAGRQRVVLYKC